MAMANPTSAHRLPRAIWVFLQTIALPAMLALACAWPIATARADGDPASDVLVTQHLFLPQDAASPPRQQAQLAALLQEAARSGYPIRVAMIASAADLGSVTELWRQPQTYAQFLGQELALVYRGPLLVVMPDGFGTYHFSARAAAQRSSLPAPSPDRGLAAAAIPAIRALAAASGHPLPLPAVNATRGTAGGNIIAWIAFAIGVILVAAAWAASFHARPIGAPRSPTTSA
jgi:hypothetical protein